MIWRVQWLSVLPAQTACAVQNLPQIRAMQETLLEAEQEKAVFTFAQLWLDPNAVEAAWHPPYKQQGQRRDTGISKLLPMTACMML